jgi:hypothetical protein
MRLLSLRRIVAVGRIKPSQPCLHEGVPRVPRGYELQIDPHSIAFSGNLNLTTEG